MRCCRAGTWDLSAPDTTTFCPPVTIPPLRVLAPMPSSPASSTTTLRPAADSSMAADKPQYPLPTMATSTRSGRGASGVDAGAAASHQYGVCFIPSAWPAPSHLRIDLLPAKLAHTKGRALWTAPGLAYNDRK